MKAKFLLCITLILTIINLQSAFATRNLRIALSSPIGIPSFNYQNYYTNGQLAYVDCTVQSTIFITAFSDNIFQAGQAAEDWNVSSNFSYTHPDSNYPEIIALTLDPTYSSGSVSVKIYSELITIYITRKSTPSLTITPTLCSVGQSGEFSSTINFYGPSSANVVWQSTGGISINGGTFYREFNNTISRVNVQHNSFGILTVYGEIPGCNNLHTNSVSYFIGTPNGSDITFTRTGAPDPGSNLCSGLNYNFQSNPVLPLNQYSYNWSIPQGSAYLSAYGPNANVSALSGGFILQMDIANTACNLSGTTSRTFYITPCGSYFSIQKNPATDQLIINLAQLELSELLPKSIQLIHERLGTVKEIPIHGRYSDEEAKAGIQIVIDIKNISKGTYYLQAIDHQGKLQSERLIIE